MEQSRNHAICIIGYGEQRVVRLSRDLRHDSVGPFDGDALARDKKGRVFNKMFKGLYIS